MALLDLKNKDNLIVIGAILVLFVAMASSGFLGTGTITGKQVAATGTENSNVQPLSAVCPSLERGEIIVSPLPTPANTKYDITLKIRNNGGERWLKRGFGSVSYHQLKILNVGEQNLWRGGDHGELIGEKIDLKDGGLENNGIRGPSESTQGDYGTFEIKNVLAPEVNPEGNYPTTLTFRFQMNAVNVINENLFRTLFVDFINLLGGGIEHFTEETLFGTECTYPVRIDRFSTRFENEVPVPGIPGAYARERPVYNPAVSLTTLTSMIQIPSLEKYYTRIKVKNTGTSTWQTNYELRGTSNKGEEFLLPLTRPVGPNQIETFNFVRDAPRDTGAYSIRWKMKAGDMLFGEETTSTFDIIPRVDNSECGSDDGLILVPRTSQLDVIFRGMRNTGNTVWKVGEYKLTVGGSLVNREFEIPDVAAIGALAPEVRGISPGKTLAPGIAAGYAPRVTLDLNDQSSLLIPVSPDNYEVAFRMKKGNDEFGTNDCRKVISIEPYFSLVQESAPAPSSSTGTTTQQPSTSTTTTSDSSTTTTVTSTNNVIINLYSGDINLEQNRILSCSSTSQNRLVCQKYTTNINENQLGSYTYSIRNTEQGWKIKRVIVHTYGLTGDIFSGGGSLQSIDTDKTSECLNSDTCTINAGLSLSKYEIDVEVGND